MTTLPSPGTKKFPDSSLEKKVYGIVESISEYIPFTNDRNRLGFGLYKFMNKEGDPPIILLNSAKIRIKGISVEELAKKLDSALQELKKQ
jgi:hypothetical protein